MSNYHLMRTSEGGGTIGVIIILSILLSILNPKIEEPTGEIL